MEENKLNADEISALKKTHGTVHELNVPINDDETEYATIYLKKLDRATYSAVAAIVDKDELQATEVMLKNLRIAGDPVEKITSNFDALRAAVGQCVVLLRAKTGSLKKI